ncbi:hypothetical protein [Roseobacter sp. HKCCA0434]|uniref:hypothetical protein n=1 Tax=Roseobacter sp. HKCCA0434 TaxID=3079297 RepID=UPI00290586EF|nr:hypothetical protein [Roseobacter sp. HKCCA0434]
MTSVKTLLIAASVAALGVSAEAQSTVRVTGNMGDSSADQPSIAELARETRGEVRAITGGADVEVFAARRLTPTDGRLIRGEVEGALAGAFATTQDDDVSNLDTLAEGVDPLLLPPRDRRLVDGSFAIDRSDAQFDRLIRRAN